MNERTCAHLWHREQDEKVPKEEHDRKRGGVRENRRKKKNHLYRIHFTLPGFLHLIYLHLLVYTFFLCDYTLHSFSSFSFRKQWNREWKKIDCCCCYLGGGGAGFNHSFGSIYIFVLFLFFYFSMGIIVASPVNSGARLCRCLDTCSFAFNIKMCPMRITFINLFTSIYSFCGKLITESVCINRYWWQWWRWRQQQR